MFFTAGGNILQFFLAMSCGGFVFIILAFQGYRLNRLMGFWDPLNQAMRTNINLQLYQSLLALGSGGFVGLGLGASRQKTGFVPFPYIDSIFAIMGEELGFFGGAIILLLFLLLAFRGFRLARRKPRNARSKNRSKIIAPPKKPSSSPIIAKIESMYGKGTKPVF